MGERWETALKICGPGTKEVTPASGTMSAILFSLSSFLSQSGRPRVEASKSGGTLGPPQV